MTNFLKLKHLVLNLSIALVLAGCASSSMLSAHLPSTNSETAHPLNLQGFPNDPAFWQANNMTIWDNLQHIPTSKLQNSLPQVTDPNAAAWIKLAIISKKYSTDNTQLMTEIMAWRAANSNHPANSLIPNDSTLTALKTQTYPHHYALLLPLQGSLAASGQAVRDGFLSAYYQAAPAVKSQQTVSFYDTSGGTPVAALYQKAVSEGADAVIGPLTKENVQQLMQAGSFPVTTIALNYTDIWFGSLPQNLYEYGLSPVDETRQIAERARAAGLSRAIIIASQDEWGERVSKSLTSQWQSLGGSVTDTFYFTGQTNLTEGIANLMHVSAQNHNKTNDKNALEHQRRQDFNVIFLLAHPDEAHQIVPLLKYYYANNVPMYATSSVYTGGAAKQNSDLNGVNFSDIPWVLGAGKGNSNRLYAVGRDAYLLANQTKRLDQLPIFPLYGATGALTLTGQHQIYRRLPWAQVRDGHL